MSRRNRAVDQIDAEELFIDSKEPDFEKYHDFLNGEVRYNSLVLKNPDLAKDFDPFYGDRMVKIVFIGSNISEKEITETLDEI